MVHLVCRVDLTRTYDGRERQVAQPASPLQAAVNVADSDPLVPAAKAVVTDKRCRHAFRGD